LLPCSWFSQSPWRSRSKRKERNETEIQAAKQWKGREVSGGMRTGICRGVTTAHGKTWCQREPQPPPILKNAPSRAFFCVKKGDCITSPREARPDERLK
jgi:hypothetical protein